MTCCSQQLRALCSPPELSDFFRRDSADPPPDFATELGLPPAINPRGMVYWDQHLARYFAHRKVVQRQFTTEWFFPAGVIVSDMEDEAAIRKIPMSPDCDFLLTSVRYDWSGFYALQRSQTGELEGLTSSVLMDWGTDCDRITDRPQNIVSLWGTRHNWVYAPRTCFYQRARVLVFRAGVDWTSWLPFPPDETSPATTLNLVVDGLELYPMEAR